MRAPGRKWGRTSAAQNVKLDTADIEEVMWKNMTLVSN